MFRSVDLLGKFISFPSFSGKENEIADWWESYLAMEGFSPHRKGNNIWLFSPDWRDSKPTVLLNSHLDTVRPVSTWTRNPFSLCQREGRLYGLGSNDAGASVVALFQSFRFLTSFQQPNNFIFLTSCEEEISGAGGIESVLSELPPIAVAVVGEPTEMQPAVAEAGLMVVDTVVRGKSGHAAREEGINAIYQAMPIIDSLRKLQFPLKSDWLGLTKLTVTMIQAGIQHNIVPDNCQFTIDVRSNECYTNKQLFGEIKRICGCEMRARSFRLNSSKISLDHPLVKKALDIGLRAFGSSTLSDQTFMSFPSLKIGPGNSSRSHTADEYIFLSEIENAIEVYICLLDQLII